LKEKLKNLGIIENSRSESMSKKSISGGPTSNQAKSTTVFEITEGELLDKYKQINAVSDS